MWGRFSFIPFLDDRQEIYKADKIEQCQVHRQLSTRSDLLVRRDYTMHSSMKKAAVITVAAACTSATALKTRAEKANDLVPIAGAAGLCLAGVSRLKASEYCEWDCGNILAKPARYPPGWGQLCQWTMFTPCKSSDCCEDGLQLCRCQEVHCFGYGYHHPSGARCNVASASRYARTVPSRQVQSKITSRVQIRAGSGWSFSEPYITEALHLR